jgi:hypothetical protein
MSAYEKFLTKDNKHEMEGVISVCAFTLRAMGCTSIAETLTLEHIRAESLVLDAIDHVRDIFSSDEEFYFEEALMWVTFQNMQFASKILSLVKDSGITDMRVILDILPEIKASHPSLCAGAL